MRRSVFKGDLWENNQVQVVGFIQDENRDRLDLEMRGRRTHQKWTWEPAGRNVLLDLRKNSKLPEVRLLPGKGLFVGLCRLRMRLPAGGHSPDTC